MATYFASNIPVNWATDADFRSFFIGFHTAFTAVGMTQTTDTGQVNTSTVTIPGTINTSAGYSIWRFSDSLQGTLPVFIKFEAGTGTTAARPAHWVSVGTGTNGAGTLTGQVSTRSQRQFSIARGAGAVDPIFVSGTTSRLHVFLYDSTTASNSMGFWVERTKDSSGAETADGIFVAVNIANYQLIPASGTIPSVVSNGFCPPVDLGGKTSVQNDIAIGTPGVGYLGKPFYQYLAVVSQNDASPLNTFQTSINGASHTFMVTNNTGSMAANTGVSQYSCMLWE